MFYSPHSKLHRELKEILKGGNEISLLLPLRYIQIESTSVAAEVCVQTKVVDGTALTALIYSSVMSVPNPLTHTDN